jgi:nucleobase:cation symporter-1, NCS1 family
VAYSSLLGPVGGIMIADYFFIRKKNLVADDLYKHSGEYSYSNGFNNKAIIALLCGIIPNIPGFLLQIKVVSSKAFPIWISDLYHYAWFVGLFVSGILYLILMKNVERR